MFLNFLDLRDSLGQAHVWVFKEKHYLYFLKINI